MPGDPGWRSGSPTLSDASYDDNGQSRWGGFGQAAPVDENGRYIHVSSPPYITPSPDLSAEVGPLIDEVGHSSMLYLCLKSSKHLQ